MPLAGNPMLKGLISRWWVRFCESEVHLDPCGFAYYAPNPKAPEPNGPGVAIELDREWLRVEDAWRVVGGLQDPDETV